MQHEVSVKLIEGGEEVIRGLWCHGRMGGRVVTYRSFAVDNHKRLDKC